MRLLRLLRLLGHSGRIRRSLRSRMKPPRPFRLLGTSGRCALSGSSDFVMLKGGLTVPVAAIQFALDLESRGCELRLDGGDGLLVGPRERVTDADRDGIRRWRYHLRAILACGEQEMVQ